VKLLRNIKRRTGRLSSRWRVAEPNLYFHVHRYRWLSQRLNVFCNFDVVVWRSVNLQFLRVFIHPWLLGKKLLEIIYRFEEAFPHLSGRIGAYPMFVIRKG